MKCLKFLPRCCAIFTNAKRKNFFPNLQRQSHEKKLPQCMKIHCSSNKLSIAGQVKCTHDQKCLQKGFFLPHEKPILQLYIGIEIILMQIFSTRILYSTLVT